MVGHLLKPMRSIGLGLICQVQIKTHERKSHSMQRKLADARVTVTEWKCLCNEFGRVADVT